MRGLASTGRVSCGCEVVVVVVVVAVFLVILTSLFSAAIADQDMTGLGSDMVLWWF